MIALERARHIQEAIAAALRDDGKVGARRATRMLLLYNSVNDIMELSMQMPDEVRSFVLAEAKRPRVTSASDQR